MSNEQFVLALVGILVPAGLTLAIALANARWQAQIHRQGLESQHRLTLQSRVSSVYEDLLHMVTWAMEVVTATKPVLEEAGAERPQGPDIEQARVIQARIAAHGSPEVRAILERWGTSRHEFYSGAWLLDRMQSDEQRGVDVDKSYGKTVVDQWRAVEDTRGTLRGITRELEQAVNDELREG